MSRGSHAGSHGETTHGATRLRVIRVRPNPNLGRIMSSPQKQILITVLLMVLPFVLGMGVGIYFAPQWIAHDEHAESAEAPTDGAHDDHIDLTQAAVGNLGLQLGKVELSEYEKSQTMPGEVIEISGQSDLSVSAPVGGVIERVNVRQGEAVDTGHLLFSLRITDQAVIDAQSKLLELLSQLEIAETEIERLSPFAEDGTVPQRRKRELEYQARQLEAQRDARVQEIKALGLPAEVLDSVVTNQRIADRVRIAVPSFDLGKTLEKVPMRRVSHGKRGDDLRYSVSELQIHPGLAVIAGQGLCHLSYHGRLYIRGQAFESDLVTISRLADDSEAISAEFGHQHHDQHAHVTARQGLKVLHVDNHVDPETQTFSFYLPLENDIVQDLVSEGRTYRQWRFKPGQRVHLRIPVARYEDTIKLPLAAVAIEGPNAVVFRQLEHDPHEHGLGHKLGDPHPHPHPHPHAEPEFAVELEAVPVRLLDRDDRFAIIEPQGELQVGDTVALNNAYKLQLVMRMNAGGGGGHHGHEH